MAMSEDSKQAVLNHMMREIQRRQADYDAKDFVAAREKLVASWRAAHPEAAQETSHKHHVLDLAEPGRQPDDTEHPECWVSDIYQVVVRRWTKDSVFGTSGGMIQIGIHTNDGTARHDWREFQWIKNQIAGPECEAFELYPAESRLLDPSNYYTLWCFPALKRIKVGVNEGRRELDGYEALAPQRGFDGR
jgi:hypothetical protein